MPAETGNDRPDRTNPRALAARLHAGQTDKAGAPYIDHLAAVVRILLRDYPDAPAHVVAAAWLHDALEDTDATSISLVLEGVEEDTVRLVEELTRPGDSLYLDWIEALARDGSIWAIWIKLADNEHKSDPARVIPGDRTARRYRSARDLLLAGMAAREEENVRPQRMQGSRG